MYGYVCLLFICSYVFTRACTFFLAAPFLLFCLLTRVLSSRWIGILWNWVRARYAYHMRDTEALKSPEVVRSHIHIYRIFNFISHAYPYRIFNEYLTFFHTTIISISLFPSTVCACDADATFIFYVVVHFFFASKSFLRCLPFPHLPDRPLLRYHFHFSPFIRSFLCTFSSSLPFCSNMLPFLPPRLVCVAFFLSFFAPFPLFLFETVGWERDRRANLCVCLSVYLPVRTSVYSFILPFFNVFPRALFALFLHCFS